MSMEKLQENVFYKRYIYPNWANIVSILGILPLALLFLEDGYLYVIPLIIFNNVMDDLDGILAAKLNIRSHVALVMAVGAHFGGVVLMASMVAATSTIIRATSRVNPDATTGIGTPTNELMRHMLFVLLLAQIYNVDPGLYLVLTFILHAVTMVVPFTLTILIRSLAKTATAVTFVNISLVMAWLLPTVTPFIAAAFITTYLYSLTLGGSRWLREQKNKS